MVYLNGEYLPLSEAKVSVLDRGFLFGDGVYEVIPSYLGRLFRMKDHINRLQSSMERIRLQVDCDFERWLEILTPLLDTNKDHYIYLQITRGVAPKRDHAFPKNPKPTIFAMCSDIQPFEGLQVGVKALTIEDSRWELCNIKATTLLANILLRQQAIDQGAAEAILYKNGAITEGAASNLFAVINNILVTPKNTTEILPGITRQVILELAEKNNIKMSEEGISLQALATASEIWVTSSTREIIPVVELDSKIIGDGKPGVVWHKMNKLFQEYKRSQ